MKVSWATWGYIEYSATISADILQQCLSQISPSKYTTSIVNKRREGGSMKSSWTNWGYIEYSATISADKLQQCLSQISPSKYTTSIVNKFRGKVWGDSMKVLWANRGYIEYSATISADLLQQCLSQISPSKYTTVLWTKGGRGGCVCGGGGSMKVSWANRGYIEYPATISADLLPQCLSQISPSKYTTTSFGQLLEIHIPPVEDIGKVYTTVGGVWIVKYIYLLCDFQIRFNTEGVNILFRSAKWAYLLGIHTPLVLDVS